MGWDVLISLVLTQGLPLAMKLYEKWGSKEPVTQADIDELKALGEKTPQSQMRDALARAGIDLNSEKAKALLGLVGA
jgi:hypothetical protein